MTLQAHADAVLALMRSAPGSPSLVVHDGEVSDGAVPPYVVVYFDDTDPELPESRPLDGQPKRFVLHIYAHCVGGHAIAARAVSQRVRGVLLGVRPTVNGRQCFPIRREDGQPPRPDETTGRMVMDKIDLYRLESEPA